jgi:DNA topoisomerase-3
VVDAAATAAAAIVAAAAAAVCYLLLPGERIMKIAEELYQGGWISYPRTETDVYDPGMDLRVRQGADS